jgi:hypothetical protein
MTERKKRALASIHACDQILANMDNDDEPEIQALAYEAARELIVPFTETAHDLRMMVKAIRALAEQEAEAEDGEED